MLFRSIGQVVQAASRVPILNLTMIPFARVPANLFKTAVRYTPGVGMLLDDVQKDFAAGGAQRDLAIARQVIGAGVMYGVMKAVEGGTMTGGFLSMTPAEREAALAEGKQPYSFKIGDKHFSYSRLEYASHIAGLAADLTEIGARASKDDKANVWLLSAAILGHSMISSTYMAGMNELMQAIGDPARAAKRWGYQFAGSFEPALTAQVATANDPYKRRVDTLTDELKSRLPYFRDQLLPQLNSGTGEPVPNNKNMTIFDVSTQSHDPVLSEAERLGVNLGKAPKTVSIGRGLGKLGKIDITPEQQNAYTQVGGQFSHELLTSLVTGPEWKDVPLPVKVKMFERAIEAGRRRAAAETLPPEAREVEVNKAVGELYKEFDKR